MSTSAVTPKTGPSSVSFFVFLLAVLPGLVTLIHGLVAGHGGVQISQILGGSGLTAIAAAAKLLHDHGIHVATIRAVGADLFEQLPQLRSDLAVVTAFIEKDFPGSSSAFAEIASHFTALEGRIAALVPAPTLGEIVSAVKTSLAASALSAPVTDAPGQTA